MEKTIAYIAIALAFIFIAPLLGTLVGAFSGWVVGFFYSGPILNGLQRAGIDTSGLELWQVGATLGFVGGFFRVTSSKKSD